MLITVFGATTSAVSQNLLHSPECTVWDQAHQRYLVSCYMDGSIVQIDTNGNQTYFRPPSGNLLSNTICGNTLYVSATTSIKAFDLDSGTELWNLVIPGSHQLDGMTCDNAGHLYVADFHNAGGNDQIYMIKLADTSWSVFVSPGHGLCQSPQDIIYDPGNNRLLVACYYTSPLQSVSLADSTVSNIVMPPFGNLDGIAMDNDGNTYVTSWSTGAVHRYGPDFVNPPELIRNGLHGPANLSFNGVDEVLAIPEFDGDSVVFIPVFPVSVMEKEEGRLEIFPNPFHGKFQIRLNSTETGIVEASLYSMEGRKICSKEDQKTGYELKMNMDAGSLPYSVYILKMMVGSKVHRKLLINIM